MTRQFRVLLLPALLFISPGARAQDNPSHETDPDLTPPKNISKLLDPKRLKNKAPNLDVEMMRKLLEFMPPNIDPKDVDPEMVKRFLRDNPEFNDPKNLDKLRDLADQQKREPRNPNDPRPPVDWRGVQDQLKKIEDVRQKKPIDPVVPRDPRNPVEPVERPPVVKEPPSRPETNMPRPKKEDKDSQDFAKWAAKNFGNSPEMRNMAKDFGKIMGDDGGKGGGFLKSVEKEWKSIAGSSPRSAGGGNSNLKDIASRLKLPDTGSNSGGAGRNSNGNSSGGSWNGGSASSSPSTSSGSGWNLSGGGGGSWSPVLILLLLGVGGFLLYRYLQHPRQTAEAEPVDTVRSWPVNPMQVNSREDVVKAFEFLSISKCGDAAVNWHHLQIADQMGEQEPDHKEAASRLACLYEKARYAPANEAFDDLDIAEARARFSQLAGARVA